MPANREIPRKTTEVSPLLDKGSSLLGGLKNNQLLNATDASYIV